MPGIKIDRDHQPRFLPHDFFDIVFHRYFPVAAMTYIAAMVGVAWRDTPDYASTLHSLLQDSGAYNMALVIVLWASIPAFFWIILHGSMRFSHLADRWYKGVSGLMLLTLLLSYILLPEWEIGNQFRVFCVATIPVLLIQYYFFVRGGLPALAAWPLTVSGLVLMIYGLVIV